MSEYFPVTTLQFDHSIFCLFCLFFGVFVLGQRTLASKGVLSASRSSPLLRQTPSAPGPRAVAGVRGAPESPLARPPAGSIRGLVPLSRLAQVFCGLRREERFRAVEGAGRDLFALDLPLPPSGIRRRPPRPGRAPAPPPAPPGRRARRRSAGLGARARRRSRLARRAQCTTRTASSAARVLPREPQTRLSEGLRPPRGEEAEVAEVRRGGPP